MFIFKAFLASFALGLVAASALPEAKLVAVQKRAAACNTPTTRSEWCSGFSIEDDGEVTWPLSGATVTYDLTISLISDAPDGATPKSMMVVNGQYPGPVIRANWGDTLVINVYNNLTTNGTSMHWHGINQANSTTEDGVNGITECPIAPGSTRTYTFIASQHGTTWYHSHYAAQYGDGVLGTILIDGPSVANYDIDLGTFPVTDYYDNPMWVEVQQAATAGPPTANSGLINGTMKRSATQGHYYNVSIESGKTYRLRLINTAVDNSFKVQLDGHPFTVIQADFVPLVPYTTDWLFLGIGQRYDVIFTANSTASNYWFRSQVPSENCGLNTLTGSIFAVFTYQGVTTGTPTSSPTTPIPTACADETGLVPYIAKVVPKFTFASDLELSVALGKGAGNINTWTVNTSAIDVSWENPSLNYVVNNNLTGLLTTQSLNAYNMPLANTFYYWVIQNTGAPIHPIHLHGHDFYILGQVANAEFSSASVSSLNFVNPMRRDVAMLPGSGYLVIALETNNPGIWLLHCHIAWHIGGGLGVQFIERFSEIGKYTSFPLSKVNSNCAAWKSWYNTASFKQSDSGL